MASVKTSVSAISLGEVGALGLVTLFVSGGVESCLWKVTNSLKQGQVMLSTEVLVFAAYLREQFVGWY